ncbi:potassium-transporting ATPase potassium-binding subunit [Capsulimonas corticalis]|uniref:Potassium-transporting ATPase potassium-binding subunit n=1 Tax=Capsulimonas corticalis TaxID=2219043 RepID=A0A402CZU1_9BACT|nr:potassium-transporting ATPase subunit KdpA [Capsulimonas corticalis]BDI33892.1 potassium-transporting ATPase potassium-binding subunit [Capsulimonas corticalis]
MTTIGWLQIAAYFLILILITKPIGIFLHRVMEGERTWLTPVLGPIERWIYKIGGVNKDEDMPWTVYAAALLAFSLVTLVITFGLLRLQAMLPFDPQHFGAKEMTPDLAFNTAVSFTTNTNWQAYSGESTMSYFSQMVSLASHNFFSAAAGIAVAIALVRGLARRSAAGVGNFWVDITRSTLYILLPLCLVFAMVFVQQGVIQNFHPYQTVTTMEGGSQIIPGGPAASQEAIKELGTNGGGFFNANSAHPFENPTPFTNFLQMLMIFAIGAGMTYAFGIYVGNTRQGWALFGAMSFLFLLGVSVAYVQEAKGNPMIAAQGVDATTRTMGDLGGNMEGKEVRFGQAGATLFATVTTDASCGAVNAMHDSFTPLGGLVPMANILSGEVIFGGVGAGLYGMLMYAILAVFIAGLMVGRTPEYLGKKVEAYEVKMAMLAALILAGSILGGTAIGSVAHVANPAYWNTVGGTANDLVAANVNNSGPHGFSEIFYAFDSATGNNGSAFAGISVNTPFWNLALGIAMLVGRFLMIIPLLAIAGSMARKKRVAASSGTFPTDNALFAGLLVGTVVIVGALAYFPAVSLGPVVEHYLMHGGRTF